MDSPGGGGQIRIRFPEEETAATEGDRGQTLAPESLQRDSNLYKSWLFSAELQRASSPVSEQQASSLCPKGSLPLAYLLAPQASHGEGA